MAGERTLMRSESERLKTFKDWPLTFMSPHRLAKNGFYYSGKHDEVRCAFCRVELMHWSEGDDPEEDHRRWAPHCSVHLRKSEYSGATHVEYSSVASRLRTFKDWPRGLSQKPQDLAEAGFYYTGQGDKTKCYYCDGGVRDWESGDDPWEQHALWFDRCRYVETVKGAEYVKKVLAENAKETREKPTVEVSGREGDDVEYNGNEKEEKEKLSRNVCAICYERERNVCFVPCGHVIACAVCGLSTDTCPVCRAKVSKPVRLYFC